MKVIVTSTYLRNNYCMPGSMLILTWAFMVILCLQAYLDRSYFGRCSNYLPLLFTRIYNATETLLKIGNDQKLVSFDFFSTMNMVINKLKKTNNNK